MKKTRIYLTLILPLLTVMSCSDFLDTTPQDFLSPQNYYNTEQDAINALGGVYNPLGTYFLYGRYMVIDADINDLTYWYQDLASFSNYLSSWNYNASQSALDGVWKKLYAGVDRANVLLENIDKIEMDEDAKNTYKGEARFLRAFYHFMLADWWGDVPLKLTSTEKATDVNIERTAQEQVYQMVVDEMEDVINNNLLNTADKFEHSSRITQTVAQAILARVYLKMAGYPLNLGAPMYEKALYWAKEVQSSNLHSLNPDYDQIFINHAQDKYDTDYRESMWEAEFVGNSATDPGKVDAYGWIGALNGIQCNEMTNVGYSYGYIRIRLKLWDLYADDANDSRKDRSISPFAYNASGDRTTASVRPGNRCMAKWRREEEVVATKHKNYTTVNFPIIRYADVLLIIAEAENELNGPTDIAINALNEVRSRAGVYLFANDASDPDKQTVTEQGEFRTIIQDERARELAGEGMRRHDLIRWGIFVNEMQQAGTDPYLSENSSRTNDLERVRMAQVASKISERDLLQPIPQSELNLNNKMTQNVYW